MRFIPLYGIIMHIFMYIQLTCSPISSFESLFVTLEHYLGNNRIDNFINSK